MKRTLKLVSILLLVVIVSMTLTTVVSAKSSTKANDTEGATGIDAAGIAGGLKGTTSAAQEDVTKIGNQLIGIITTVGVVVAVIILLVLGIKYMMGSASEKAEYKKTMIPYLVGAILIFGASAITKVVVGLAQGITG